MKRAKKEIMSMVVEALAEKGGEQSTVKSASDSLLELCRGLKKSKSVGMIALDTKSPDYVPSLPKPSFKSVLMNFSLAGGGSERKRADEPKPQERGGKSRVSESESEKEPGEKLNVEKVMSKKMTKPKNKKIQNDKNIFQNLNDVHILNDVEREGNLCGPENSGREKFDTTHDVGGGSESEKDEIGEDDSTESWADTRVKGWLRPRVKTRRMNESAPERFWRQETGGPFYLEADTLLWGLAKCRFWALSSPFPLYAFSDHLPLKWVRKCEKGPVSEFTIEQLSDLSWIHSYLPGPENSLFDALSR